MSDIIKNPISVLQEHAIAKMKITPSYTVIMEKTGSHINVFQIKVELNSNTAVGHGSSKKEAKVNAALNMLSLLNLSPTKIEKSEQILDTNICSSSSINDNGLNTSEDSISQNINYIGKLQELTDSQIIIPEYITKDMYGPPHNMEFVIVCKYNDLEEEGKGKTKKEAKMMSAKKMYNRLLTEVTSILPKFDVDGSIISKALTQFKIIDTSNSIVESSKKALAHFPKVSKNISIDNVHEKPHCVSEYHTFLKNSFNSLERKLAIDKLKIIMSDCQHYISSGKDIDPMTPMLLLKTVLKDLNINFVKKATMNIKRNFFLYNLELKTNPPITEFGCGKTNNIAKIIVIYQMANTLALLLI